MRFKAMRKTVISGLLCLGGICSAAGHVGAAGDDIDLGTIVVTGSKIDQEYTSATRNISIITQEDIMSSGAVEIAEVLDTLPSVDILEYGSLGSQRSIHLRGASASQVLILIDGRPINSPRDGVIDFNMIPLNYVERIEVLRGPASSIYGANAVGGVVNIITKDASTDGITEVSAGGGSFNTGGFSLTQGKKIRAFDYMFHYDFKISDGHRDNADYDNHVVNGKLGFQVNEKNRVTAQSGYHAGVVGVPGLITNVDLDDQQKALNTYFDLTYQGSISEGQDVLVKLYNNADKLRFIETPDPLDESIHRTKVYGADAQVSQVFYDAFRVAVGVNYLDNRLDSSDSGRHTYFVRAGYAESEFYFLEKSALKIGARWDDYSNFGDEISPSASLNYWLHDTVKFHALTARSFRAPTFNDLFWPRQDFGVWGGVEGNRNLTPETAVSFEAGLTGYFFNTMETGVTFFKTDFDDLIEWTMDNAFWWRPNNISSAEIKGVEFEVKKDITPYLKTYANYTYQKTRNKLTEKELIYRPRNLYKAGLLCTVIPPVDVGLKAIYKTERFTDAANTQTLDSFFVMNGHIAYRLMDSITAQLEVKNMFNRIYQEQKDYPLPERTWYARVSVTF